MAYGSTMWAAPLAVPTAIPEGQSSSPTRMRVCVGTRMVKGLMMRVQPGAELGNVEDGEHDPGDERAGER